MFERIFQPVLLMTPDEACDLMAVTWTRARSRWEFQTLRQHGLSIGGADVTDHESNIAVFKTAWAKA
jgi:hypothetical protein